VHGHGEQAFPHKLRTGPWQYVGGITIHQSLSLDETASKYWVSRSCWDWIFATSYFQEFCLSRQTNFYPILTKDHQKNIRGAALRTPSALLPPTKVGAKCLGTVVLDNPDRALHPWVVTRGLLITSLYIAKYLFNTNPGQLKNRQHMVTYDDRGSYDIAWRDG